MNRIGRAAGMRAFIIMWFGQFVSLVGTGCTGFALGVWVYQRTGSATQFALIALAASLPGIAFMPVAGSIVDRHSRRSVMILSYAGAGVSTMALALLFLTQQLQYWHICAVMALRSLSVSFLLPAQSATTTLLVPKRHLGRASGMTHVGQAGGQIIAPLLAGALLGLVGVEGILLLDCASFAAAAATLLLIEVPRPAAAAKERPVERRRARGGFYGWDYIRQQRGLLNLLLLLSLGNLLLGMVSVMLTPLVLSFADPATLGRVLAAGGAGMLAGGVVMSVWGGPRRRVAGLLAAMFWCGLCVVVGGLSQSGATLALVAFLFFFGQPVLAGCSQVIWQSKVAPEAQGRVFAIRGAVVMAALPLAYALAGPLADYVFKPLATSGGTFFGSAVPRVGDGSGRGLALMLVTLGGLYVLLAVVGSLNRHLRGLEAELPELIAAARQRKAEAQTRALPYGPPVEPAAE